MRSVLVSLAALTWLATAPAARANLLLNEVLADPPTGADVNGDGVASSANDEFVEIYNDGVVPVDIGAFTISDATAVRHTFPLPTIVPPGCAVLVFGGGTPAGGFGHAIVQTASTGTLSLNNTGDTVVLGQGPLVAIDLMSYGAEGGNDQSLTRSPDGNYGPFVQHLTAAGATGPYSPGRQISGSDFLGCRVAAGIPALHERALLALAAALIAIALASARRTRRASV